MKWIGMYIAAASAVCTLAMAADIIHGFRRKVFWFPCKYFSLNATFLTLLAVAMKPPIDLSDEWHKADGPLTKITSLTFMCVAMVNFMSSLGSMSNQMILTNTIAIAILALSIVGNIMIQVVQLDPLGGVGIDVLEPTIWILVLLVTLVSSAITVPNIKRSLELKYQEMHEDALRKDDDYAVKRNYEKFTIANQKEKMKKYWVMAETSSLEFVMARSVVFSTSTVFCLLATCTLGVPSLGILIWTPMAGILSIFPSSDEYLEPDQTAYKWSTKWIIAIQSIGMVIGLVAPTLRSFNNVRHKCSTMSYKSFTQEFNIENYWTETLVDWRDSSLALQIPHDKCRKCFHVAKRFILNICCGVQLLVVMFSKMLVLVFVLLITSLIACFIHIRNFFVFVYVLLTTRVIQHSFQVINSNVHLGVGVGDDIALNLNRYVVLLEGEQELLKTTVKRICQQADKVIRRGQRQQSQRLIVLLQKFGTFSGVRDFDNIKLVQSLHSQEPSNCWTLPLVTLTSIAIALPNVGSHEAKQLLISTMSEGMSFAKLVDTALDTNGELKNMRKAASVAWTEVVIYNKWLDVNLQKTSITTGKNSMDILQKLSNKAESIIREFKREVREHFMENPILLTGRLKS